MTEHADSAFCDLLETIAPEPSSIVMIIKSFFDESYEDDILCVAGYTFTSANARAIDREWKKMLLRFKKMPYFRMSACNARRPPFDILTEAECIALATNAIKLINKYAFCGVSVTVKETEFYSVVGRKGFVSTPYEFCAWLCIVASQRETNGSFPHENASFVFEAGCKHERQANKMMKNLFKSPKLREQYRYSSHAFVDKVMSRPTQAADLWAWQAFKDFKRRDAGNTKSRGDFCALIKKTPHFSMHATAEHLREMIDRMNNLHGIDFANELIGLAIRNPESKVFPRNSGENGDRAALSEFIRSLKKEDVVSRGD